MSVHQHAAPTTPDMASLTLNDDSPVKRNADGIEKKKRTYSLELYKWTQEMWENARQDIERRSSVSSVDSSSTEAETKPQTESQIKPKRGGPGCTPGAGLGRPNMEAAN
ncbi:hypothetical protein IAU60_001034 [Kwoniella sp. DSM 27419]